MRDTKKKLFKRISAIVLTLVILPVAAYGILLLSEPLCRSNSGVRSYVLRRIPAGTEREEAVRIIEENNWSIREVRETNGLRINDEAENVSFAGAGGMSVAGSGIRIIGSEAMLVKLGEFSLPFHTAVFAYLAFDENGKLIETAVTRHIDAP